jgi:DNA polymerase-3 subunit epsilon
VRQYFTASETRSRLREMVALAVRVDTVTCAHALEAEVRELRLLVAHRPAYNRRSRNPHAAWWATLTEEAFPRLSVVRTAKAGALGPFRSRASALRAVDAVHDAVPIRPCTVRIAARDPHGQPCALAELGRCAAPCAGRQSPAEYEPAVDALRDLIAGDSVEPLRRLADSLDGLAERERFEAAGERRDRMVALVRALDRGQRLATLAAIAELIAARSDGQGGWEFAVIRHGRLASAGVARRGTPPMPVVDVLVASAETVMPEPGPLFGAPVEETALLSRWLTQPGIRLVRTSAPWAEPAGSAARWREWADRASAARMPDIA